MSNKYLHNAKRKKNDEFYTMYEDIDRELSHFKQKLKGKVVYCNCDIPSKSNFTKWLEEHMLEVGINKVISTGYVEGGRGKARISEIINGEVCSQDFILDREGNFDSEECLEYLSQCDVVITNPPFSLYRKFYDVVLESEKGFIILANLNAITYKNVFPSIKDEKCNLGYNSGKGMSFNTPQGIKKLGMCAWYTSFRVDRPKQFTGFTYNENYYKKYDNYDAININKTKEIPDDYNGVMGVPVSSIYKLSRDQFDIIGMTTGRKEFGELSYPTKRYRNAVQVNKDGSRSNGSKINTRATIAHNSPPNSTYYIAENSKHFLTIVYARVLIKRKTNDKNN